jgi:hypothetical protein
MGIAALDNYAPFEARVDCSGSSHHLRWEAGDLVLLDHDDPEGERTLTALGGEVCPCIELLDIWARHADDLRVLTLTSRGPGDQPRAVVGQGGPQMATAALRRTGPVLQTTRGAALTGYLSTGVGRRSFGPAGAMLAFPPFRDVARIVALNPGLTDRLALTVSATWAERLAADTSATEKARPALVAALYGRVACALQQWIGEPPESIEVEMIGEDQPASAIRTERGVRVEVPFSWLIKVWGRGLAITMDRFVLVATKPTPDRLELVGLDATLSTPATVTVQVRPV